MKVEQLRSRLPLSSNQRASTKRYTPTNTPGSTLWRPGHVCTPCTRRRQAAQETQQHIKLAARALPSTDPSQAWSSERVRVHTHSLAAKDTQARPHSPNQEHTSHTHTPTGSRGLHTCTTPTEPHSPEGAHARPSRQQRTRCAAPAKPLAPHGPPHVLACALV